MFGRKDIMLLTGLKATRASEVIKLLTTRGLETVKGHGKGKYCFIKKLSESQIRGKCVKKNEQEYIILQIQEDDYGCEERPQGQRKTVFVPAERR